MSKWFTHALVRSHVATNSFAQASRIALTAAGLGLSSMVWLGTDARAEDEIITTAAEEGSLLVATRESPQDQAPFETAANNAELQSGEIETDAAEGEILEPTSESSEHSPDLAEGLEDDGAAQFGAALAKVAQVKPVEKPAPVRTARRTARATPESVPYEPVKFQEIAVGKSTKSELIAAWGEPAEVIETDEGDVHVYDIEPFKSVEALVTSGGIVSAIKVSLADALEPAKLARQLSLKDIDPVTVNDDEGQPLGQAFPERGVLFMFADSEAETPAENDESGDLVSDVVIQPLDSRAFALRAESHLHGPYKQNIGDLKTAIALDAEFAHAHWLLSEIYLATGQADLADAEAAAACDLDPTSAAYGLRRGQTLALLGEYDDAVLKVRSVLDNKNLTPLVRAQAMHEMARLASLGDVEIASKAIPFDTRAIEIADKLANSADKSERHAAKLLLVDAHLAIGEEIARQSFNQKVESLSMWVGRASGLAEDFIASDEGSVELRLLIAQRALAALSSFKPTLDPTPWVTEAEEAAQALAAQSDDPLWQQRIKWELGIAYHNALRVEHSRRETSAAIRYGQQAIQQLAEGAAARQAVHSSEQLVGQLYFHMGAVYAVHQQNHAAASQWYEKAAPLLTGPRPVSELYSPRREGEMLVSIGVTCWQLGQQARALELTRSGANLVELAVEDGILAKSALQIPYANLAAMYDQMGEKTNAAKYTELSKTVVAVQAPPKQASRTLARTAARTAGRTLGQRPTIQANAQQLRQATTRR